MPMTVAQRCTRREPSRRWRPEAGLTPKEAGYVELTPRNTPDLDTFLRGYLAAGPLVSAIRTLGEEPVRDTLTEGVRPLTTASGGIRFEDGYRYLIATS